MTTTTDRYGIFTLSRERRRKAGLPMETRELWALVPKDFQYTNYQSAREAK